MVIWLDYEHVVQHVLHVLIYLSMYLSMYLCIACIGYIIGMYYSISTYSNIKVSRYVHKGKSVCTVLMRVM
jgi:hypothetical protein